MVRVATLPRCDMKIWTVQRCKSGAQGRSQYGVELFTDETAARAFAEAECQKPHMTVLIQPKTVDTTTPANPINGQLTIDTN